MRLTILGCNGPFPEANGACSGYLLESDSGKTKVAIDLGSGCLGRLIACIASIGELDALILSHLHFDHMSDVPVLGYMLDFSNIETLKLICPDTPVESRKLIKGKFDVYPPSDTRIGEFDIEFVKARHPVETYAVKVKCDGATFVYTGDTNECAEIALFCDKADLLLADAGLAGRDWTHAKPHLSPEKCALLAKEAKVKQLVLTHLSPLYDHGALLDEALAVFADTVLAEPGMVLRI